MEVEPTHLFECLDRVHTRSVTMVYKKSSVSRAFHNLYVITNVRRVPQLEFHDTGSRLVTFNFKY